MERLKNIWRPVMLTLVIIAQGLLECVYYSSRAFFEAWVYVWIEADQSIMSKTNYNARNKIEEIVVYWKGWYRIGKEKTSE